MSEETHEMTFAEWFGATTLSRQCETSYEPDNIDKFATFSYLNMRAVADEAAETAAREVLGLANGEPSGKRTYLWRESGRVDAELCHVFEDMEGTIASADKARWALSAFDRMVAGEGSPDELPKEGERGGWLPQRGTALQWMEVVEQIYSDKHPRAYFKALHAIYGEELVSDAGQAG